MIVSARHPGGATVPVVLAWRTRLLMAHLVEVGKCGRTAGALLFEVWTGDPRPVPADKPGYEALLAAKGIRRLPNPRFAPPASAGRRAGGGDDYA